MNPISPHIFAFKLTIAPLTSILLRITGMVFMILPIVFVLWLLCVAVGGPCYMAIQSLFLELGPMPLMIFYFLFWYHFVAGIRKLIIELTSMIKSREGIKMSGYIAIIASVALAAFSAFCVW